MELSGMRNFESFNKRSRGVSMSTSLALEAEQLVKDAAAPCKPGEKIKAQLNRACERLGYHSDRWRVRAAWYREAGCWSASALEELRSRAAAWKERRDSLTQAKLDKYGAIDAALADRLETLDPDFYRAEIARLRDAVRRLGGQVD
jgi:hypothetical protein